MLEVLNFLLVSVEQWDQCGLEIVQYWVVADCIIQVRVLLARFDLELNMQVS